MTHASRRAEAEARDQTERRQRIIARAVTVLVHLLLLLLLLSSDPLPITEAEGGSAGGSAGNGGLQVTYIDNKPTPPAATPVVRKPVAKPRTRATPVKSRVVTTPVPQAADPVPPDAPEEAAKPEPEESVAVEAPPTPRANHVRGQPPGMRVQEIPTASAGSAGNDAGYGSNSSGAGARGSSMGVDGFQVIYDLVYERQLREWRDQGMTELFLPLPGTRRLMVCPLEVALRRGSSKCRMVEQDDPALASIGDARKVLVMQRIYHLGDEVWSGPGPYR